MTTQKLLLNSSTQSRLQQLATSPPHATLLIGGTPDNADEIASWYANEIVSEHQGARSMQFDMSDQGIDFVRQLRAIARFKNSKRLHVYTITQSDELSAEAQSALLKQLEEPVEGATFILAASQQSTILPTIVSRSTIIHLARPDDDAYQTHFGSYEANDVKAGLIATGGNTKLLQKYLTDEDEVISSAKDIASASPYDRLRYVSQYAADRNLARQLVVYLKNIAAYLMHSASGESIEKQRKRVLLCLETEKALHQNANVKLLLVRLFLTY